MTVELTDDSNFLAGLSPNETTACRHDQATSFNDLRGGGGEALSAHDWSSDVTSVTHHQLLEYDEFLVDLKRSLDYSSVVMFHKNTTFSNDEIFRKGGDGEGGGGAKLIEEEELGPTSSVQYEQIWTPEVIFRVTTICVVMVLTLVGNVALISVITYHASLRRKRVSVFLLNLAVGDLMVCFLTMTSEILFVAFGEWVLGAIACKLIVYGQIVTLASTTFLLTAMSIDRYQVVVQPLQAHQGPPYVWCKLVTSWLLALLFAAPQLFIFVETEETLADGQKIVTCKSAGYTAEWQRKVYFSFMTGYILIIPTSIMSFCYLNIIRVVWLRTGGRLDIDTPRIHFVTSRRRSLNANHIYRSCGTAAATPAAQGYACSGGTTSQTKIHRPRTQHTGGTDINNRLAMPPSSSIRSILPRKVAVSSKRNVLKMTMSVIVGFVICWTPYFVVSLVRIFSDYRIQLKHALSVSEIMALVHSALNPLLYMLFSTRTVKSLCCPMQGPSMCRRPDNSPRSKQPAAAHERGPSHDGLTWTEPKIANPTGRCNVAWIGYRAGGAGGGGGLAGGSYERGESGNSVNGQNRVLRT